MSEFADIEERVRRANVAFDSLQYEASDRFLAVEVRCNARGHLLARVHSTSEGALFISTTKHVPGKDELARKRGRRLNAGRTPTLDIIDFLPDEDDVHPPLVVRCACGNRKPLDRRLMLGALEEARRAGKPVRLVV